MKNVRKTNAMLRLRYKNARNIRHYQGERGDETHLTTDIMPNSNQAERIFAGYTDELEGKLELSDR